MHRLRLCALIVLFLQGSHSSLAAPPSLSTLPYFAHPERTWESQYRRQLTFILTQSLRWIAEEPSTGVLLWSRTPLLEELNSGEWSATRAAWRAEFPDAEWKRKQAWSLDRLEAAAHEGLRLVGRARGVGRLDPRVLIAQMQGAPSSHLEQWSERGQWICDLAGFLLQFPARVECLITEADALRILNPSWLALQIQEDAILRAALLAPSPAQVPMLSELQYQRFLMLAAHHHSLELYTVLGALLRETDPALATREARALSLALNARYAERAPVYHYTAGAWLACELLAQGHLPLSAIAASAATGPIDEAWSSEGAAGSLREGKRDADRRLMGARWGAHVCGNPSRRMRE